MTHLRLIEMLFVIGSVLELNRLCVQGACEVAAAHIVCLSVCLSVRLAVHGQQPLPELIIYIGTNQIYMYIYVCRYINIYN